VILQPAEQPRKIPAINHPRRGDAGESCVRDRGVGVDECLGIMGVAVEREHAARFTGAIGELVIEILTSGIAVDLIATPRAAASANTLSQSAIMPGRESDMRPRGWASTCTPGVRTAANMRSV